MPKINQNANAPMNTLKPQPGQYDSYNPKFHPLPGDWAKEQLNGMGQQSQSREKSSAPASGIHPLSREHKSQGSGQTEIQRALAAERAQHEYWEEWQGVKPGKAIYENPRELQNTLLPSAKYGTEGQGYG